MDFRRKDITLRCLPHHSQLNPPVTEHHSMIDAHCYWNMPSVISVAGACSLEMCAVTFSDATTLTHPHSFSFFKHWLQAALWVLAGVRLCSTMQTHLSWEFQNVRLIIWETNWHLLLDYCSLLWVFRAACPFILFWKKSQILNWIIDTETCWLDFFGC